MERKVLEKTLNTVSENNKIYNFFKEEKRFNRLVQSDIENTPYRGKPSQSSLQYTPESFCSLFGGISDNFEKLYKQAIHDGKGLEKSRIRTLHSSSLISFLTFCNVNESNPITFNNIDGLENKIFTDIMFEKANKITRSSSQIDICLTNSTDDVLFLESKFSEYVNRGKVSDISECYYNDFLNFRDFFNANDMYLENPSTKKDHKPGSFDLCVKKNHHIYAEGVKQMICHFLGAKNYAEKNKDKNVYLGTILYKFDEHIVPEEILKSYENVYKNLAKSMNSKLPQNTNLHILNEPILYCDVYEGGHAFSQIVTDLYH